MTFSLRFASGRTAARGVVTPIRRQQLAGTATETTHIWELIAVRMCADCAARITFHTTAAETDMAASGESGDTRAVASANRLRYRPEHATALGVGAARGSSALTSGASRRSRTGASLRLLLLKP